MLDLSRYSHFVDESSFNQKARTLLEWGDDTLKEFANNLIRMPYLDDLKYYKEKELVYRLNNHGYRTDIKFEKGISGNVFLGDSNTAGIGLYYEDTWAFKVNEYVGGNYLNLAEGGEGFGSGFRKLLTYLEYFDIKNVFIYYPLHYRYEYWFGEKQHYYTIRPTQLDKYQPRVSKQHSKMLAEERNSLYYSMSKLFAIVGLCQIKGIPVYNCGIELPNYGVYGGRAARDLTHAPVLVHDYIADLMKKKYDNKIEVHKEISPEYFLRDLDTLEENKNKWTQTLF